MAYFDGVKIGDRIWSFENGYGKVIDLYSIEEYKLNAIIVKFENGFIDTYDSNGKKKCNENQTLFWDKIEIEIPGKPKIELKEKEYFIDFTHGWKLYPYCVKHTDGYDKEYKTYLANAGLTRNDKEIAKQALKQIKRFARLLALRDQECHNSRGYFPRELDEYYYIYWDSNDQKYKVNNAINKIFLNIIPLKTKEDAELICDILNEDRFDLED